MSERTSKRETSKRSSSRPKKRSVRIRTESTLPRRARTASVAKTAAWSPKYGIDTEHLPVEIFQAEGELASAPAMTASIETTSPEPTIPLDVVVSDDDPEQTEASMLAMSAQTPIPEFDCRPEAGLDRFDEAQTISPSDNTASEFSVMQLGSEPEPASATTNVPAVPAEYQEAATIGNRSQAADACLRLWANAWNWVQRHWKSTHSKRRLKVRETISLGEKRLVALIEVDGEQFLVGGGPSSLSVLAHLEHQEGFPSILGRSCAQESPSL